MTTPSGEGYTPENTRLVCVAVNLALNRFGEEVLERVCKGFLAYRELKSLVKSSVIDSGGVSEP